MSEATNTPATPEVAAELVEAPTTVALREVTGAVAKFDEVEKTLAALLTKHRGVIFADIQTPKGLRDAKAARLELREPRYAVQNAVRDAKGPLNALKGAIASQGESMVKRILEVEEPIDKQITDEETRRREEKERLEREEAARQAELTAIIKEFTDRVPACIDQPSAYIAETIQWLDNAVVDEEEFGDRLQEAQAAVTSTREKLVLMKAMAEEREAAAVRAAAEAERVRIQQAELARQAQELAAREAALLERERAAIAAQAPAQEPEEKTTTLRDIAQALPFDAPAAQEVPATSIPAAAPTPAAPTLNEVLTAVAPPTVAQAIAAVTAQPVAPIVKPQPKPAPRPEDHQVVGVLAMYYQVQESTVVAWLQAMDLAALAERFSTEADVPF